MSQYFAPIQRSLDAPVIFNSSLFNKKSYQSVVGVVKQPVPINEAVGVILSPNETVDIYNGLVQVGIIDSEPIEAKPEEEYKPLEEVVITLESVAPEDIKADAELDALVAAEESSKILVIYDEDITLDVEELEP
tara:strand:+ start:4404 stop:4805 length:402 start_codon:yes stop_codon:yes gene_type:complete